MLLLIYANGKFRPPEIEDDSVEGDLDKTKIRRDSHAFPQNLVVDYD